MNSAATMFDRIGTDYDKLWTTTTIGRLQRDAVWRHIAPLFRPGQRVLDIGCGTGEDALWLQNRGVQVMAIDASGKMVAIARHRGVDAAAYPVQSLDELTEQFDGAISNFGALNCVPLADWTQKVAARVRPGGYLAICVIGRFCLWETLWFALRGQFRKSARRWRGEAVTADLTVWYPTVNQIEKELSPRFQLITNTGIGIFVPPSFVSCLSDGLLRRFAAIDRSIETLAPFRIISDHRLLIFRT